MSDVVQLMSCGVARAHARATSTTGFAVPGPQRDGRERPPEFLLATRGAQCAVCAIENSRYGISLFHSVPRAELSNCSYELFTYKQRTNKLCGHRLVTGSPPPKQSHQAIQSGLRERMIASKSELSRFSRTAIYSARLYVYSIYLYAIEHRPR